MLSYGDRRGYLSTIMKVFISTRKAYKTRETDTLDTYIKEMMFIPNEKVQFFLLSVLVIIRKGRKDSQHEKHKKISSAQERVIQT